MKTKLNLKRLLVSILLVAICLFNTNIVQATGETFEGPSTEPSNPSGTDESDLTTPPGSNPGGTETTPPGTDPSGTEGTPPGTTTIPSQTPGNSENQDNQDNSGSQGGTSQSLATISKELFNSLIPNTIEISTTKTDFVNAIVESQKKSDDVVLTRKVNEISEEVKGKLLDIFNNTSSIIVNDTDIALLTVEMSDPMADFYTVRVTLKATEEYSKDITIVYSKESAYSTENETYVKKVVNSIKFAQYKDEVETYDAVFTIYNIGDEENASKWTPETYDFSKLINDSSVTIKTSMFIGGMGGATPWGIPMLLHFYKDGVLYETKSVWNLGAYGTILDNGTPVNMAKLDKEYDKYIYEEMEKQLNANGITEIIGAYELTAYGRIYENMSVSFDVGTKYNGKQIVILHKKSDDTYETLTATVKDGKATVIVNEFSPFMIALANNKNLDNEPNTGVGDYTVFASAIAFISLAGLVTLKFKK